MPVLGVEASWSLRSLTVDVVRGLRGCGATGPLADGVGLAVLLGRLGPLRRVAPSRSSRALAVASPACFQPVFSTGATAKWNQDTTARVGADARGTTGHGLGTKSGWGWRCDPVPSPTRRDACDESPRPDVHDARSGPVPLSSSSTPSVAQRPQVNHPSSVNELSLGSGVSAGWNSKPISGRSLSERWSLSSKTP